MKTNNNSKEKELSTSVTEVEAETFKNCDSMTESDGKKTDSTERNEKLFDDSDSEDLTNMFDLSACFKSSPECSLNESYTFSGFGQELKNDVASTPIEQNEKSRVKIGIDSLICSKSEVNIINAENTSEVEKITDSSDGVEVDGKCEDDKENKHTADIGVITDIESTNNKSSDSLSVFKIDDNRKKMTIDDSVVPIPEISQDSSCPNIKTTGKKQNASTAEEVTSDNVNASNCDAPNKARLDCPSVSTALQNEKDIESPEVTSSSESVLSSLNNISKLDEKMDHECTMQPPDNSYTEETLSSKGENVSLTEQSSLVSSKSVVENNRDDTKNSSHQILLPISENYTDGSEKSSHHNPLPISENRKEDSEKPSMHTPLPISENNQEVTKQSPTITSLPAIEIKQEETEVSSQANSSLSTTKINQQPDNENRKELNEVSSSSNSLSSIIQNDNSFARVISLNKRKYRNKRSLNNFSRVIYDDSKQMKSDKCQKPNNYFEKKSLSEAWKFLCKQLSAKYPNEFRDLNADPTDEFVLDKFQKFTDELCPIIEDMEKEKQDLIKSQTQYLETLISLLKESNLSDSSSPNSVNNEKQDSANNIEVDDPLNLWDFEGFDSNVLPVISKKTSLKTLFPDLFKKPNPAIKVSDITVEDLIFTPSGVSLIFHKPLLPSKTNLRQMVKGNAQISRVNGDVILNEFRPTRHCKSQFAAKKSSKLNDIPLVTLPVSSLIRKGLMSRSLRNKAVKNYKSIVQNSMRLKSLKNIPRQKIKMNLRQRTKKINIPVAPNSIKENIPASLSKKPLQNGKDVKSSSLKIKFFNQKMKNNETVVQPNSISDPTGIASQTTQKPASVETVKGRRKTLPAQYLKEKHSNEVMKNGIGKKDKRLSLSEPTSGSTKRLKQTSTPSNQHETNKINQTNNKAIQNRERLPLISIKRNADGTFKKCSTKRSAVVIDKIVNESPILHSSGLARKNRDSVVNEPVEKSTSSSGNLRTFRNQPKSKIPSTSLRNPSQNEIPAETSNGHGSTPLDSMKQNDIFKDHAGALYYPVHPFISYDYPVHFIRFDSTNIPKNIPLFTPNGNVGGFPLVYPSLVQVNADSGSSPPSYSRSSDVHTKNLPIQIKPKEKVLPNILSLQSLKANFDDVICVDSDTENEKEIEKSAEKYSRHNEQKVNSSPPATKHKPLRISNIRSLAREIFEESPLNRLQNNNPVVTPPVIDQSKKSRRSLLVSNPPVLEKQNNRKFSSENDSVLHIANGSQRNLTLNSASSEIDTACSSSSSNPKMLRCKSCLFTTTKLGILKRHEISHSGENSTDSSATHSTKSVSTTRRRRTTSPVKPGFAKTKQNPTKNKPTQKKCATPVKLSKKPLGNMEYLDDDSKFKKMFPSLTITQLATEI